MIIGSLCRVTDLPLLFCQLPSIETSESRPCSIYSQLSLVTYYGLRTSELAYQIKIMGYHSHLSSEGMAGYFRYLYEIHVLVAKARISRP